MIQSSVEKLLALVPPSLGLSTQLLNRNHYDTYFLGMPSGSNGEVLCRHGDKIQMVRNSQHPGNQVGTSTPFFGALGPCDNTMNIGGIKVSSVEIEQVRNLVPTVQETAAIVVSGPNGGPSKLVIYAVLSNRSASIKELKVAMQNSIKANLNPLFGINDVIITQNLPRTASNKVMRRLLRDEYFKNN
jgi:acetyl-CoA synthetase